MVVNICVNSVNKNAVYEKTEATFDSMVSAACLKRSFFAVML